MFSLALGFVFNCGCLCFFALLYLQLHLCVGRVLDLVDVLLLAAVFALFCECSGLNIQLWTLFFHVSA